MTAIDYALSFDGVQNYCSLGTLGNLGSSLSSGLYCSFQIKTTSTTDSFILGQLNPAGATGVQLELNSNSTSGQLRLFLRDNNGKVIDGHAATTINDGNLHQVIVLVTPSTNTIVFTIGGNNPSVVYATQTTPATFSNFANGLFLGGRDNAGINSPFACTIDNFQIGTSPSQLYGSYPGFSQVGGSSKTLVDTSGNNNNGTLMGSPAPIWVTGFNNPQPIILESSVPDNYITKTYTVHGY